MLFPAHHLFLFCATLLKSCPAYHADEVTNPTATTPLTRLNAFRSIDHSQVSETSGQSQFWWRSCSIGVFEEHKFGPFRNNQRLGSETATSRASCIARSCCNMVGVSIYPILKLFACHLSHLALHQLNFCHLHRALVTSTVVV